MRIKSFILSLLLGASILGAFATSNDHIVRAIDKNSYYSAVDLNLKGEAFRDKLSNIINNGARIGSYDEAYKRLCDTDEDPNNKSHIECFYTGVSYPKGHSGSDRKWNREHTWAKSHGFPSEKYDPYSDIHHLRATEMKINTIRGNMDFDDVENHNGKVEADQYGNKWIKGVCFEPRDEVKGDVARIMFYMYTKYNKGAVSLELVEKIPTSKGEGNGQFGGLSTLISWHVADPVSGREERRNEVIYGYQNNRNPYIDHPEYVSNLFNVDLDIETKPEDKPNINLGNIEAAIRMIDYIPANVTLNDKVTVMNALAVYETLNSEEKKRVTNYSKLEAAINKINELEGNTPGPDPDPDPDPEPEKPTINSTTIDFSKNTITSNSYENNLSVNIDDYKFNLTKGYLSISSVRLGGSSLPLIADNDSSFNGAMMESGFSYTNIEGIEIAVKPLDNMKYKLYIGDTLISSGSLTKQTPEVIKGSANKLSGDIKLYIIGNKARLDLNSLKIIGNGIKEDIVRPNPPIIPEEALAFSNLVPKTSLKLIYNLNNFDIIDLDMRIEGIMDSNSFNRNAKYGIALLPLTTKVSPGVQEVCLNSLREAFIIEPVFNNNKYHFNLVIKNMEGHYNDKLHAVLFMELHNKLYLSNSLYLSATGVAKDMINNNLITDKIEQEVLKKLIG